MAYWLQIETLTYENKNSYGLEVFKQILTIYIIIIVTMNKYIMNTLAINFVYKYEYK